MSAMNVLLVDDHALFREALRALLMRLNSAFVLYECSSVEAAIATCDRHDFTLVLLDLSLTDSVGLSTLETFRKCQPQVPVAVLSGEQSLRHISGAIERGAVGFIPKTHTADEMAAAMHRIVVERNSYLPSVFLEASKSDSRLATQVRTAQTVFSSLSPRKKEVTQLMLRGYSNKSIAAQLGVSEGTIKAHVSAILQTVGASSRVKAALLAAQFDFKAL